MNLNLQKARLTRLCDGRPLNFSENSNGEIILTILSDDNTKSVSLKFDEFLTDEQIKERLLVPALTNLDAATFPERWKRKINAIETELKELQNV